MCVHCIVVWATYCAHLNVKLLGLITCVALYGCMSSCNDPHYSPPAPIAALLVCTLRTTTLWLGRVSMRMFSSATTRHPQPLPEATSSRLPSWSGHLAWTRCRSVEGCHACAGSVGGCSLLLYLPFPSPPLSLTAWPWLGETHSLLPHGHCWLVWSPSRSGDRSTCPSTCKVLCVREVRVLNCLAERTAHNSCNCWFALGHI